MPKYTKEFLYALTTAEQAMNAMAAQLENGTDNTSFVMEQLNTATEACVVWNGQMLGAYESLRDNPHLMPETLAAMVRVEFEVGTGLIDLLHEQKDRYSKGMAMASSYRSIMGEIIRHNTQLRLGVIKSTLEV